MKRVHIHIHRAVPGALMAAATAIPFTTTVEILARVAARPVATPALAPVWPVPGSAAPLAPSRGPAPETDTSRTYLGPLEYIRSGAVQATITVAGRTITAVAIAAPKGNPRSAAINARAIPILQSETLQAQSATIDIVSGATYTSHAYEQSLQAALDQANSS